MNNGMLFLVIISPQEFILVKFSELTYEQPQLDVNKIIVFKYNFI